jgi:hypothetical protein
MFILVVKKINEYNVDHTFHFKNQDLQREKIIIMAQNILVLSADLNKWSVEKKKINMNFNLYCKETVYSLPAELDLDQTDAMINATFESIANGTKEHLKITARSKIEIRDEEIIKQGFESFYNKMVKDIMGNRNGKSKNKSNAITRYNLFYLKEPEINSLSADEKYIAYMDIINRKVAKDQITQVGTYIKEALDIKPDDKDLLLYMARYLKESRKADEALNYYDKYFEKYAEDVTILLEAAKVADQIGDNKKSEKIYSLILKIEPGNLDALIKNAQVKYYNQTNYMDDLNTIAKENSDWLKDYLKRQWDYHLPNAKEDMNPLQLVNLINLSNTREAINYASKKIIPGYYNERAARVMFNEQEILSWHKILLAFDINEYGFTMRPKKVQSELAKQ